MAPEKIEQCYSQSPLISQIFIDGSSLCSSPVALIVPDGDSLCKAINGSRRISLQNDQPSVTSDKGITKQFYLRGKFVNLVELCNDSEAEQFILNEIIQLGKTAGLKGFERVIKFHLRLG